MSDWTLTDKAATILKSYGVDDPEAARAVVALVLDEAAAYHDRHAKGYARTRSRLDEAAHRTHAAAIRALIPEAKP